MPPAADATARPPGEGNPRGRDGAVVDGLDARFALATSTRRRDRHLSRLAWLHLIPWASVIAWRMVAITPSTSSVRGSAFVSSSLGRALVLVSVIVGVAALVAVALETWRARRHPLTWILFAALVGAFARREHVDAFDVAWFLIVPCVCAWVLCAGADRDAEARR